MGLVASTIMHLLLVLWRDKKGCGSDMGNRGGMARGVNLGVGKVLHWEGSEISQRGQKGDGCLIYAGNIKTQTRLA